MPGHGFPIVLPIDSAKARKWLVARLDIDGTEVFDLVIPLRGPAEADLIVDHMSRAYGPATTGYRAGHGPRRSATAAR